MGQYKDALPIYQEVLAIRKKIFGDENASYASSVYNLQLLYGKMGEYEKALPYEIAQMDLSNTDLVVLSACETALGDLQGNEGVIGLQRAFKMAGVKQMIVSLWRIPDKETTELMTLFYHNWLHGQPAREALRTAQMKMKKKYPPYYWAAFVLVE